MAKPEAKTEPLSADEAAWLMKIYTLRKDNLFYAGFLRCMVFCTIIITVVTNFIVAAGFVFGALEGRSFFTTSAAANLFFCICLSFVVAVILCSVVYQYLILPYKSDALSGVKLKVPFTIASNEFYVITSQYFFRFENNYDKMYEVDKETYDSCEGGDATYMYQGINSGHIFGQNDSVVVKFFTLARQNSGNYY